MNASIQARRSGDAVAMSAIVLGTTPLGERDLLVKLLTPEEGRLSAIAKSAQGSKRRFGPALEPGNFVQAHLVVPRDHDRGAAALWRLDRTDLRDSFLHLRTSYYRLDTALFAVSLIRDLVPEGVPDDSFFRALGRYLRDLGGESLEPLGTLPKIAFWAWAAHRLGYGDFVPETLDLDEWSDIERAAWSHGLGAQVPDFAKLWMLYRDRGRSFPKHNESSVYKKWVEITGLPWPHFERCLGFSSFSPSPSL